MAVAYQGQDLTPLRQVLEYSSPGFDALVGVIQGETLRIERNREIARQKTEQLEKEARQLQTEKQLIKYRTDETIRAENEQVIRKNKFIIDKQKETSKSAYRTAKTLGLTEDEATAMATLSIDNPDLYKSLSQKIGTTLGGNTVADHQELLKQQIELINSTRRELLNQFPDVMKSGIQSLTGFDVEINNNGEPVIVVDEISDGAVNRNNYTPSDFRSKLSRTNKALQVVNGLEENIERLPDVSDGSVLDKRTFRKRKEQLLNGVEQAVDYFVEGDFTLPKVDYSGLNMEQQKMVTGAKLAYSDINVNDPAIQSIGITPDMSIGAIRKHINEYVEQKNSITDVFSVIMNTELRTNYETKLKNFQKKNPTLYNFIKNLETTRLGYTVLNTNTSIYDLNNLYLDTSAIFLENVFTTKHRPTTTSEATEAETKRSNTSTNAINSIVTNQ